MAEAAKVPEISLAGRAWPVPMLAIKQNRIVVPALMQVMPVVARIAAVAESADPAIMMTAMSLSIEEFDLIADAVYTALTRGTPGLARTEFDNLEIGTAELLTALPLIMQQTGIMKQTPADEVAGAHLAGEAAAGKSTGIAS